MIMDYSELIDDFFTGSPDPEQVRAFEKRIESDPAFAEEVAFYLSTHTMAREVSQSEKKQQFRNLYLKNQSEETSSLRITDYTTPLQSRKTPVRKLIYFITAAAAVAGIIFGVYTQVQPVSPQQLAKNYEQEHLKMLGVTMGSHMDSLQTGLNYYNGNKADQALLIFEQLCRKDSTNSKAWENAGLAALRLKDYDKALTYFRKLETFTLRYNRAVFYQAVTLMDRNGAGDVDTAQHLLQQVVQKDLEGKETAQEWLGEWKK
jgi:tetratricopeptide (TPR) repeat protein